MSTPSLMQNFRDRLRELGDSSSDTHETSRSLPLRQNPSQGPGDAFSHFDQEDEYSRGCEVDSFTQSLCPMYRHNETAYSQGQNGIPHQTSWESTADKRGTHGRQSQIPTFRHIPSQYVGASTRTQPQSGPSSMQISLGRYSAARTSASREQTRQDSASTAATSLQVAPIRAPPGRQASQVSTPPPAIVHKANATMQFSAPPDFVAQHPLEGQSESGPARLVQLPVSCLPRQFQSIFSFAKFNKAQTIAFHDLYSTDKNVVVTAPTGAGKTVMFELALLRMLSCDADAKAVYLAPMKALCSERFHDWSRRLSSIDCKVLLMTSDTTTKLSESSSYSLIVATPEKWDLMTRKVSANNKVMTSLRLFLIDEVHILREKRRGAVMEVLVSRMKAFSDLIRFVAVSATIPNADDFALWIGKRDNEPQMIGGPFQEEISDAAQLYTFSESFRPCPLRKYVYGFRNQSKDLWTFDRELNSRLLGVIASHLDNKGALIFCPTRKMCNAAAQSLAAQYYHLSETNGDLPWTLAENRPKELDMDDPQLQELYACGVGFHHAGLSMNDRQAIEYAFLNGYLNILCCTSSLAVGVNLPAFLVVIRGTAMFDGAEWTDYKDLDVFQMMGRAGRPQFDTEGVCVIMTEESQQKKWTDLLQGETIVESTLHETLIEHANAEILIRQGCSVLELQAWLSKTFLFVRLCKRPEYYMLPGCENVDDATQAMYVTAHRIMAELSEHKLVDDYDERKDDQLVVCSPFGVIMAKSALCFETMQTLMKVKQDVSIESLLETIARSKEYESVILRSGEAGLYSGACQVIRFPPPGGVSEVKDKVSVILQAKLAGLALEDLLKKQGQRISVNPRTDIMLVMEHAPNILRSLIEVLVEKEYGISAKNAFELLRSVSGSAWEGTAAELQQVFGIGCVLMTALSEAGVKTIESLALEKPDRVMVLLSKTLQGAKKLIQEARRFPRFSVSLEERPKRVIRGKGMESTLTIVVDLLQNKAERKGIHTKCFRTGTALHCCILITTTGTESRVCQWHRVPIKKLIEKAVRIETVLLVTQPGEEIVVTVACDRLAGSATQNRAATCWQPNDFLTEGLGKAAVRGGPFEEFHDSDSDLDLAAPVTRYSIAKGYQARAPATVDAAPSRQRSSAILREIQLLEASTEDDNLDKRVRVQIEKAKREAATKASRGKRKENESITIKKQPKKRANKTAEDRREEKARLAADKNNVLQRCERIRKRAETEREARRQKEITSEADTSMSEPMSAEVEEQLSETVSGQCIASEESSEEGEEEVREKFKKRFRPADWDCAVTKENDEEVTAEDPREDPYFLDEDDELPSIEASQAIGKAQECIVIDDSDEEQEGGEGEDRQSTFTEEEGYAGEEEHVQGQNHAEWRRAVSTAEDGETSQEVCALGHNNVGAQQTESNVDEEIDRCQGTNEQSHDEFEEFTMEGPFQDIPGDTSGIDSLHRCRLSQIDGDSDLEQLLYDFD